MYGVVSIKTRTTTGSHEGNTEVVAFSENVFKKAKPVDWINGWYRIDQTEVRIVESFDRIKKMIATLSYIIFQFDSRTWKVYTQKRCQITYFTFVVGHIVCWNQWSDTNYINSWIFFVKILKNWVVPTLLWITKILEPINSFPRYVGLKEDSLRYVA